MKLALAILLLAVSLPWLAEGVEPATAADSPDPIVGKWRYSVGPIVTLDSDGTAHGADGALGAWKHLEGTTVERKYRIAWKDFGYVDELTLSKDGAKLAGKNRKKEKIWLDRLDP